ncbi:hypothetical protein PanWU01x14_020890, partial [Parasponia andersonii]
ASEDSTASVSAGPQLSLGRVAFPWFSLKCIQFLFHQRRDTSAHESQSFNTSINEKISVELIALCHTRL